MLLPGGDWVKYRTPSTGKITNNIALNKLLAKCQNVQNVEMATARPLDCLGTKYWTWMVSVWG